MKYFSLHFIPVYWLHLYTGHTPLLRWKKKGIKSASYTMDFTLSTICAKVCETVFNVKNKTMWWWLLEQLAASCATISIWTFLFKVERCLYNEGSHEAVCIQTLPQNESTAIPVCDPHLTTSTAPARTFGSLPIIDTLAANDPSILNTTNSVPRGTMVR